ncbi:ABC transporter permease [Bacillus sp. YZJH907-2]|uniref:ABC transporter permease n=2 Tax=Halalkalibacter suaedae TaxID=2822140 RepID=A0A941APS0_9BACI|nr:ABC transporter permease [Bacillus suaedae]
MLEIPFYTQVEKSSKGFFAFAIILILFFSGISFTFVIPGLKGFDLFFMIFTLFMYFMVANIFVGLFKARLWFVLMICLLVSSLGMGWRIWLEWGEFSLVEHMNLAVYVGYPIVISLIITGFYSFISSMSGKRTK